MTEATELLASSQQIRTRNASGRMENHLYFRGDKVIKILQERNEHLQEISDRLKLAVAKHKERKEMLDQAEIIIVRMECRCHWVGDELLMCGRCSWLDDLKHMKFREEDSKEKQS